MCIVKMIAKSHGSLSLASKNEHNSSLHCYDHKRIPRSERGKQQQQQQQHCTSSRDDRNTEACQPYPQEGVVTPLEHHQHIVQHCQYHSITCVANVLNNAHRGNQHQTRPVLYSHPETILDLGRKGVQPLPSAPDRKENPRQDFQVSIPVLNKQIVPNSNTLGAPELHILNCDGAPLETDSNKPPHLLAQDSSILDYSISKKLLTEKRPKNGLCKKSSQVKSKCSLFSSGGSAVKLDKITLLKRKSEPDHHPSSERDPTSGTDTSVPETISRSSSSGTSSPETSSEASGGSEACSGSDCTLVAPQDFETDSWLDVNPDYWEEIREPPIEKSSGDLSKENSGKTTKLKSHSGDRIQGQRKEEAKECVTKRICESLLTSGSYSCKDFKQTEPKRTRRIRFSEPCGQSEQEKKQKGCDSNDRRTDRGKKTQGLTFQWTDFDIDASLEFISGSSTPGASKASVVAKSQDSSDSKGEFLANLVDFTLPRDHM